MPNYSLMDFICNKIPQNIVQSVQVLCDNKLLNNIYKSNYVKLWDKIGRTTTELSEEKKMKTFNS